MESRMKKVLIAGGGITGLSAAFYLLKEFKEKNIQAEIILTEKSDHLGGKIQTLRKDGFVIEKGPDSFLARKMPMIDLVRDLGMEDQLVPTNPKGKKSYILLKKKFHPMPPGMVYGIPTQLTPFMKTGLISPVGKIRAAMDLVIPRKNDQKDEALGHFISRRLGREVLEHIAEPLLAGIYAGNTNFLSLKATFPQFHDVEKKYRSLILGMAAGMTAPKGKPGPALPAAAKNSMFLSLKNGLISVIEQLQEVLKDQIKIQYNSAIDKVKKNNHQYLVTFANGEELAVDGVILATPAFETANILSELNTTPELNKIPYASVANVVLAFNQQDATFKMEGSGFVVPRTEGTNITACTWTSTKWLHTAPDGKVLLRLYVGHHGNDVAEQLTEEEILTKVKEDLRDLMGITAEPLFVEITRWVHAMPQYPVGHIENLQKVRDELKEKMPNVLITGSAYQGIGVPDCVKQGKDTAIQLIDLLTKKDA